MNSPGTTSKTEMNAEPIAVNVGNLDSYKTTGPTTCQLDQAVLPEILWSAGRLTRQSLPKHILLNCDLDQESCNISPRLLNDRSLIGALKELVECGYSLAVVSNAPVNTVRAALAAAKLDQFFPVSRIFSAHDLEGTAEPSSQNVYELALNRLAADAAECLVISYSSENMHAASEIQQAASRLFCVGLLDQSAAGEWGSQAASLSRSGAQLVINQTATLADLLRGVKQGFLDQYWQLEEIAGPSRWQKRSA